MNAAALAAYNRQTVEGVFRDYKGRRIAIIKALTNDVAQFYEQCDPEKDNLCLYGYPDEKWEVKLPNELIPTELPEPVIGINFARYGSERDWLTLVAMHSDIWLLSVAFYFGARFDFDREDRTRLFSLINNLPNVYEVVTGAIFMPKPPKEKSAVSISNHCSKPKSGSKGRASQPEKDSESDEEDTDEEDGDFLCGACGKSNGVDKFWICCDMCEKWFHGKCVKITPAKAANIKQYKCPSCRSSNKRRRP